MMTRIAFCMMGILILGAGGSASGGILGLFGTDEKVAEENSSSGVSIQNIKEKYIQLRQKQPRLTFLEFIKNTVPPVVSPDYGEIAEIGKTVPGSIALICINGAATPQDTTRSFMNYDVSEDSPNKRWFLHNKCILFVSVPGAAFATEYRSFSLSVPDGPKLEKLKKLEGDQIITSFMTTGALPQGAHNQLELLMVLEPGDIPQDAHGLDYYFSHPDESGAAHLYSPRFYSIAISTSM